MSKGLISALLHHKCVDIRNKHNIYRKMQVHFFLEEIPLFSCGSIWRSH